MPQVAGTPTRLACALLVGGALLGTNPAEAAPLATPPASAKDIKVAFTGLVKDSKGNPLPGVTVLIKGTKTGTTRVATGFFTSTFPRATKP
ncbi:hypothetical protein ACFQT0_10060 [Hymenobacter humi]|uniref:Carboxypeptidase regulatory-like domain-containing protein n=1 Tax=Hymenobacter humi TaxID=1411620 RepID=A0ABW2U2K0_9BACT